ncbi:MAG: Txe/YoeB family addiction module toxin [Gammaproteobacteria bacterium]|jgi:toxin YoeB
MNLYWTSHAWEDYIYWQTKNKKILKRINQLIKDIQRNPFSGLGKPEPLKFDLAGKWSRRINETHRLVYQANNNDKEIIIYQCRYHY